MRKSVSEMLSEFLRELALVVLGVGFLDQLFSDHRITLESAVNVFAVGFLLWLSGVFIEITRRE